MKKLFYLVGHIGSSKDGTSVRSTAIARALADTGTSVCVVAPEDTSRTKSERFEYQIHPNAKTHEIPVFLKTQRSGFLGRLMYEFMLCLAMLGKIKREKPDLVIASYPPAFLPIFGLIYCKFRGIPFILELRDLMAGALRANKYGKLRIVWWCAQLYENYLIRLSNYVSVVSPGMVNPVAELISSERVMKSYNGYENTILKFDEFTLDDEDQAVYQKIIAQINYKEDDKLCLYAGALTQSYDLVTIITAFHRSKVNAKLLILGNGERLDEYKDLVLELGLNNVFFFGFVSRDVVLKICKISSVGLPVSTTTIVAMINIIYILKDLFFTYHSSKLPLKGIITLSYISSALSASSITNSSLRKNIDPTPDKPGRTDMIISRYFSGNASKHLRVCGLGPMMLISPIRILKSCGNSLILVFRKILPTGSTLGSSFKVTVPVPIFGLSLIIVANLSIFIRAPSLPILF